MRLQHDRDGRHDADARYIDSRHPCFGCDARPFGRPTLAVVQSVQWPRCVPPRQLKASSERAARLPPANISLRWERAGSAEPPPTTGEMLDSRVKVAVLGEDLHAAADCMKLITAEAGLQFGESCTDILSQLRRKLDGRRQELGSTFGKRPRSTQ